MASIDGLGKYSGSYGPSTFSVRKGKNTMRTKPVDVKNPNTLDQQIVRGKFKKVVALSRLLFPVTKRTLASYSIYSNGHNTFISINHNEYMVTGEFPDFEFDFSKMIVSLGELKIPQGGKIKVSSGEKIIVEWKNNSGRESKHASNEAFVLLFNETKNNFKTIEKAATRLDKMLEITPPEQWINDKIHVYLMFKDREYEEYSDSIYLGNVLISKKYTDISNAETFSVFYTQKIHKEKEFELKGIGFGLVKVENEKGYLYKLNLEPNIKKPRLADKAIAELINQTKNVVKSYFGPDAESIANLKIKAPIDWSKEKIQANLTIIIQVKK